MDGDLSTARMGRGAPKNGSCSHRWSGFPLLTTLWLLSSLVGSCGSQSASWNQNGVSYSSSSNETFGNNSVADGGHTTRAPRPRSTCVEARIRCALRQGCGLALQGYMFECDDLMKGRVKDCDNYCKSSLIALTSTEEGAELMECQCSDNYCEETKQRVEVCREEVVLANARGALVSCDVAHLICSADTQCATALSYYDKFCKKMFAGRSCSFRCNNSISILARQDKAAKLATCECDGSETFDCFGIKENMARLCFPRPEEEGEEEHLQEEELEETNEIDTSSGPPKNTHSGGRSHHLGISVRGGSSTFWRKIRAVLFNLLPSSVVRWNRADSHLSFIVISILSLAMQNISL